MKRLMVGLDQTAMDPILIRQSSKLISALGFEAIYFLHVSPEVDVPEDMAEVVAQHYQSSSQNWKDAMRSEVESFFSPEHLQRTEFLHLEGNTTEQMLKLLRQYRIDLLLLGKKQSFPGQGVVSGKIARLAGSHVLFFPENGSFRIERILNPVDFSEYSGDALQHALYWGRQLEAEVLCQHVLRPPQPYFPYIPSESTEQKLIDNTYRAYDAFLKRQGIEQKPPLYIDFHQGETVANAVYRRAVEEECELIVVGSRGRSDLASVFLGSVAERLTATEKSLPVLIIKREREAEGVLESLKRLLTG